MNIQEQVSIDKNRLSWTVVTNLSGVKNGKQQSINSKRVSYKT